MNLKNKNRTYTLHFQWNFYGECYFPRVSTNPSITLNLSKKIVQQAWKLWSRPQTWPINEGKLRPWKGLINEFAPMPQIRPSNKSKPRPWIKLVNNYKPRPQIEPIDEHEPRPQEGLKDMQNQIHK